MLQVWKRVRIDGCSLRQAGEELSIDKKAAQRIVLRCEEVKSTIELRELCCELGLIDRVPIKDDDTLLDLIPRREWDG